MRQLDENPIRGFVGKELRIENKYNGNYEVLTSFGGLKISLLISQEKIFKLVWKSEDENDLKESINKYISRKIYKQFTKQHKEREKL